MLFLGPFQAPNCSIEGQNFQKISLEVCAVMRVNLNNTLKRYKWKNMMFWRGGGGNDFTTKYTLLALALYLQNMNLCILRPNRSVKADKEISFNIKNGQKQNLSKKIPMSSSKGDAPNPVGPDQSTVSQDEVEDEVDDRKLNRRSPNGFLLPDPLPKGEILRDSLKQVKYMNT